MIEDDVVPELLQGKQYRHRLPCVPAGTQNDFAFDLGIDRRDVAGALDAFIDGQERRIYLGRVTAVSSPVTDGLIGRDAGRAAIDALLADAKNVSVGRSTTSRWDRPRPR